MHDRDALFNVSDEGRETLPSLIPVLPDCCSMHCQGPILEQHMTGKTDLKKSFIMDSGHKGDVHSKMLLSRPAVPSDCEELGWWASHSWRILWEGVL